MTVSATPAKAGPFTGNDSASAFAFSFKVFAASDIRVVETLIATEVETDLVLNTNYTVVLNNDQDNNPGGTITYKVGGVTTALPSTKKLTIVGDFKYEQPSDLPDGGAYRASVVENALDRNTMLIKQTQEEVARAVKVPVSSSTDPNALIASLLQAESDATAAAAAAAISESNAATSESNAAASASAAAAAAASVLWNDVAFKTFADSPITLTSADSGKLFAIDATGGNVVVNLPEISTLTLPWTLGVKKTDASGNLVIVNRAGTDTIDGNASKSITSPESGATFVPDTDTSPDTWVTAQFGIAAGNQVDEVFTEGVDFTAGASTVLTLAGTYGSEGNISVHFDAAFQGPDTYSLSDTTLVFSSAVPIGVNKVYVKGGATLAIGVPSDGSVSAGKVDPAYEATLAKLNAAQNFTAPQRSAPLTDNDLSFDLADNQNFTATPTGAGTLTFTGLAAGLNGNILLVNGSNYAIAKAASVKCNASFLTTISASGTYWISYYSDGTNVYVSTAGAAS